jgi:hypothetical protein
MNEEPQWKMFLNWGVVIMFIALPIFVMLVQLAALRWPQLLSQELPQAEFKHLVEYHRALTAMALGLAGFKSWEVVKANHRKENHEKNRNN